MPMAATPVVSITDTSSRVSSNCSHTVDPVIVGSIQTHNLMTVTNHFIS